MSINLPLRLAVMGIGKIARDQHLPTIAARNDVELVAVVSRTQRINDVPSFTTLNEAFEHCPDIDAVVLCTPPVGRHQQAREVLISGRHVFLEKPPGASLAAVNNLKELASESGRSLFVSWHSRCAAGVAPARHWLADKAVKSVKISWKEDVRRWHPGQDWIFDPGGMGVFDPAINALSIATYILPRPFSLSKALLEIPANKQAPVRASMHFADLNETPITADFDFPHNNGECWNIEIETDSGQLLLTHGGAMMLINGHKQDLTPTSEYSGLYDLFVDLIRSGKTDADVAPFVHVADAFMLGERRLVEPFSW